ncbi:MAG: hypothetical protein PHY92_05575 [Alphaproteobacteria bacterium]|nr:hypothetical protein [Alphaproteobacteria bacterium]
MAIREEFIAAAYVVEGPFEEVNDFLDQLDSFQRKHGKGICVYTDKQEDDPAKYRLAIYYQSGGRTDANFREIANLIAKKPTLGEANEPVRSEDFVSAPRNFEFIRLTQE